MTEVSVIIPMRNAARTIEATLASALAQCGVDFEVIVIDDGSTDGCDAYVAAQREAHPNLRLAYQSGGVSAARNLGVALARGALVAFLDADDLWAPDKLAVHLDAHRANPRLAASYARIAFLPERATSLADGRTLSSLAANPLSIRDVIGENPVCTSSNLVVRRDVMLGRDGFAVGSSHAEDQEFVLRLLDRGGRVVGIDRLLVGYRFSRNGLSMDFGAMHRSWRQLASRYLTAAGLPAAEALYLRYLARRALRSGSAPRQALGFALAGMRLDASAFLSDARRGWATLVGALCAPVMPDTLRRHLFA